MPVRPAIGRPTPREARHRHGAPVRAPFLRCSVSIRYLRNLRFLKVRGSSASQ